MSLNRLFLRALAINALSPQPDDPDQITMAGDRVFDSRLDPLQFDHDQTDIPCIIVYTDDDQFTLVNRSSNNGPFVRHVDLRIEIALGSFDTVVEDGENFGTFGVPTTDAEMEARLDFFEQQVRWALMDWPNRRATDAFLNYVVTFIDIASHVSRDESGNNRLAMRRLMIKCRINDDCPPRWGFEDTGLSTDVPSIEEADLGGLPEWLRPMLVASQNSPSMKQVVNVLSGTNNTAVLLPLFKRLGVNMPKPQDVVLEKLKHKRGPIGSPLYLSVWRITE